jgi:hypothetical protein
MATDGYYLTNQERGTRLTTTYQQVSQDFKRSFYGSLVWDLKYMLLFTYWSTIMFLNAIELSEYTQFERKVTIAKNNKFFTTF